MSDMSPWRVEWLRLVRTKRLIALFGAFVFLGFVEPLSVYYLPQILKHSGSARIKIIAPPPVPADAIGSFVNNALLIGLIVTVVVAASACMVDAKPTLSAFYRTRTRSFWQLLVPRVVVAGGAGVAAFIAGLLCAWYETAVLIGAPAPSAIAATAAYGSVYLLVAVAVTAVFSTVARSTVATMAWTLAALLLLGVVSVVPQIAPWLPSELAGASNALVAHTESATHYLKAAVVSAVAIVGLLLAARHLGERREVS